MAGDQAVTPLEHVAPVYVEESDGYVDIKQTQGDHTLYTPEEARELAAEILAAADAAEE
jgi:hypothetical protein